jgi:hypothetical protein
VHNSASVVCVGILFDVLEIKLIIYMGNREIVDTSRTVHDMRNLMVSVEFLIRFFSF